MPRLRSAVAAALGARNMPRLEFRQDVLSQRQAAIEDVFRRLEEEREVEAQLRCGAAQTERLRRPVLAVECGSTHLRVACC